MSQRLFIFLSDLRLNPPFDSLLLNERCELIAPYQKRTLDELNPLQRGSTVSLIIPATIATTHIVNLPTLKKAELTVPNILEEELIQDRETLHFALQKTPLYDKHYLVNIIDKQVLIDLLEKLNKLHLHIDTISNDVLFDKDTTLTLGPDYALLSEKDSVSVLAPSLMHLFKEKDRATLSLSFPDTHPDLKQLSDKTMDEPFRVYFAKQSLTKPTCNLLQGPFQKKQSTIGHLPLITGSISLIAVLLFITTHLTHFFLLKKALDNAKKDSMQLYRVFFPSAQAMVSPRFRVEQALKSQQSNTENQHFFALLSSLDKRLATHRHIQINDIQYDNNQMEVEVKANNFQALEQFKEGLAHQSLTVKQLSAKTKKHGVVARWRLSS